MCIRDSHVRDGVQRHHGQPLRRHRQLGRQPAELRGRVPHQQDDAVARGDSHRQPGSCLTQPHGCRSGSNIRSRFDDEPLLRHAERRRHLDDRLQQRREPPRFVEVGAEGARQRRDVDRRRPALHALGRDGGHLLSYPLGHRHRLLRRSVQLHSRARPVAARVRAELHERVLPCLLYTSRCV